VSSIASDADLLRDYIRDVRTKRLDAQYQRASKRLDRVWDENDMSTWRSALKWLRRLVKLDEKYAVVAGATDPPPSMKKAHAVLLRALTANVNTDYWVVEKVRLRVPYSQWWKQWEKRYQRVYAGYRQWRIALKAEAKRQGVRIPPGLF
jgi:hypothetical protein